MDADPANHQGAGAEVSFAFVFGYAWRWKMNSLIERSS